MLLKSYLEIHDSNGNCLLYEICAKEILATNQNISIPKWMVVAIRERNPAILLRLYMSYQMYSSAADVVLFLLRHPPADIESGNVTLQKQFVSEILFSFTFLRS